MSVNDDTGLVVGVDTHLDTHTAALPRPRRADRQTRVLHHTLARLGQRILMLAETAAGLEKADCRRTR